MVPYWLYLLGGCFTLGILHGVIPDEHTWPITFSYSVGAATGRGGMLAGAFFSLAFTIQRAAMSQLVYFAIAPFLITNQGLNGPVYVAVGVAMAAAGYLLLRRGLPHWHPLMWISRKDIKKHEEQVAESSRIPIHWTLIHGFIAGFGVDAGLFTTFVYLVAVPAMPVFFLGFLPGAAFGAGTFTLLMVIGLLFGGTLQAANRWGRERIQFFGSRVGARALFFGGLLFVGAGFVTILGLDSSIPFDLGNLIIYAFMITIIVPVMLYTWRETREFSVAYRRTSES